MTAIGLHLTKCAGTSLLTSLRRALTEDEIFMASSFYENIIACRPFAWDIDDLSKVRLVFGHYIHEALIALVRPRDCWDFFLFTGVRNPIERAYSQFRHLERVQGHVPWMDEFIAEYGASMCDEIIRAFPSLVVDDAPKWESAARILTAFNYIYSTENYNETIQPVVKYLEVPQALYAACETTDNINKIEARASDYSQISDLCASSDDQKLYEIIKPAIGAGNAGLLIAERLGVQRQRDQLFASVECLTRQEATSKLFKIHADMAGYELHILGSEKRAQTIALLNERKNHLAELIDYVVNRQY